MRYYDKNDYSVYVNGIPSKVSNLSYINNSFIEKSIVDRKNKTLKVYTSNNLEIIKGNEISNKLNFKFDLVILSGVPVSVERFENSFYLKKSIRIIKRISKDTIQNKIHRYLENDVLWVEYDY